MLRTRCRPRGEIAGLGYHPPVCYACVVLCHAFGSLELCNAWLLLFFVTGKSTPRRPVQAASTQISYEKSHWGPLEGRHSSGKMVPNTSGAVHNSGCLAPLEHNRWCANTKRISQPIRIVLGKSAEETATSPTVAKPNITDVLKDLCSAFTAAHIPCIPSLFTFNYKAHLSYLWTSFTNGRSVDIDTV